VRLWPVSVVRSMCPGCTTTALFGPVEAVNAPGWPLVVPGTAGADRLSFGLGRVMATAGLACQGTRLGSRTGTTRARGTITAHRRAVVRRHPGPGEQVRSSVSEDEVGRGVRISGQDVAETQELAKRRSSGVRERAKASNASRSRSSIGPPACWPEDAPEAAQGCLLFVRGARGPVVGRALTHTGSVRNSDFRTRMGAALGPAHVDSFVADHVMGALGGRTAGQALADGEDLQLVWDAVCTELGIPAALRYGPDDPPARSR
ncbi:MAG: DUF3046 domain-containing protein, partial [Actinomycetes bacterium]